MKKTGRYLDDGEESFLDVGLQVLAEAVKKQEQKAMKGGPGSGNKGHAERTGLVGGSAPQGRSEEQKGN